MAILPLNEEKEVVNYCQNLTKELAKQNFRIKIFGEKSLNYRIRQTHQKKIPYYLVIGKQEVTKKILKLVYSYQPNKISELSEVELYIKLKEENNIN